MGEEAEKPLEDVDVPEEQAEAPAEVEEEAEPQEVEIVRAEGSQPKKRKSGFIKRINKLNAKISAAETKAEDAAASLERERKKNEILELALKQQKAGTSGPPKVEDFEGLSDPKYIEEMTAYNQRMIAEEVKRQTEPILSAQPPQVDHELRKRQENHYAKAEDLGTKDYEEAEDAAIEVLGRDVVNELIKNSDNSHLVLYYLGKNPGEAEEIAELVKTNPIRATLKLGGLEKELKVQTKATSKPAPDPDHELAGGTPSLNTERGPKGATYA